MKRVRNPDIDTQPRRTVRKYATLTVLSNEKEATLQVSNLLKDRLETTTNIAVIVTVMVFLTFVGQQEYDIATAPCRRLRLR